MTDYKAMYYTLFNQISDAINQLQAARQQAEEMFIAGDDTGDEGDKQQGRKPRIKA